MVSLLSGVVCEPVGLRYVVSRRIHTARSLGISKDLRVDLHPPQKFLPACRMSNVLDADVDTLLEVPVADDLADNNSYGTGGNVEDDTGFAAKGGS